MMGPWKSKIHRGRVRPKREVSQTTAGKNHTHYPKGNQFGKSEKDGGDDHNELAAGKKGEEGKRAARH